MAVVATRDVASAREIQQVLAGGPDEATFMPDFLDLPELMPNAEFKAKYGAVGSPRYQQVADDIERRLDTIAYIARSIARNFLIANGDRRGGPQP